MNQAQTEHSTPTPALIELIMNNSSLGKTKSLTENLQQLKAKKNLEPKKTTQYVSRYLQIHASNFPQTFNILMNLCQGFQVLKGRDQLKLNIFVGFESHFRNGLKITDKEREQAFGALNNADYAFLEEYISIFTSKQLISKCQSDLERKVKTLLESRGLEEFKRALKILKSTRLQHLVSSRDIIAQIKRHVSTIRFAQIKFYFDKGKDGYSKQLIYELVEDLAALKRAEADKMAVEIVEKYHIDPDTFPQLIWNIQRKGIYYNYRTYPLYVCEAKYMSNRKHMCHIVVILMEDRKFVEAKSLIAKYNLMDEPVLEKICLRLKDVLTKAIRNRLLDDDDFGATQLRVLKTSQTDYLELIDFGIQQKDVIWVNNQSDGMGVAQELLLKAKYVGFDSETSGGIHTLSQSINEILQVATEDKVFIFDIPALQNIKRFHLLLEKLFFQDSGQILLGHSCSSDVKLIHSIINPKKKMKDIVDTQKLYKTDKAISLKDLVYQQFKKPLSKFEQCSGWDNRPLRRAQLHYAALDALVLVKIYTKAALVTD